MEGNRETESEADNSKRKLQKKRRRIIGRKVTTTRESRHERERDRTFGVKGSAIKSEG